jgi:uncharacterized protein (DUF433 family)
MEGTEISGVLIGRCCIAAGLLWYWLGPLQLRKAPPCTLIPAGPDVDATVQPSGIPVWYLEGLRRGGCTQILTVLRLMEHSKLTAAQVQMAWDYAAEHVEEMNDLLDQEHDLPDEEP